MRQRKHKYLEANALMHNVTIIMYHYVRDLPLTRYPRIKGLKVSEFKAQLNYLESAYNFVTFEECLKMIHRDDTEISFPENAALLTFDDGYAEHFTEVFPLLDERGIQGAFFPPVKAIMDHKVLDVNKIHFILASADDPKKLVSTINSKIEELSDEFNLKDSDFYMDTLANETHRYDPWEIVYVKRLLQRELPKNVVKVILGNLFEEYVGIKEEVFSKELYMTPEQIRCMLRHGMFVGGHGYSHQWLNTISIEEQRKEVLETKKFLEYLGVPKNQLTMCYPYGAYDTNLLKILKDNNFVAGLTTEVGKASLDFENRFLLDRFDTNDFPKKPGAF